MSERAFIGSGVADRAALVAKLIESGVQVVGSVEEATLVIQPEPDENTPEVYALRRDPPPRRRLSPGMLGMLAGIASVAMHPSPMGHGRDGERMAPQDRLAWKKRLGIADTERAHARKIEAARAKRERKARRHSQHQDSGVTP